MDDQRQAADAAACAAAPDRPAPDAKANQLAKLKKAISWTRASACRPRHKRSSSSRTYRTRRSVRRSVHFRLAPAFADLWCAIDLAVAWWR